jgi:tartrate dehydratase beta subunit/fumarate hydratase class I family protein
MIKMEPADQEGGHGPDLGLSLSEHVLTQLKDEIDNLHRGDKVRFNATILSMGDTHHLHHLHAFDIKKIPGHKDVEAHVHTGGRYKFKITPHND